MTTRMKNDRKRGSHGRSPKLAGSVCIRSKSTGGIRRIKKDAAALSVALGHSEYVPRSEYRLDPSYVRGPSTSPKKGSVPVTKSVVRMPNDKIVDGQHRMEAVAVSEEERLEWGSS